MYEILEFPPERRMAAFWRKLPCVPSSLLLASGPTLNDPGLSWAPCSSLVTKDRLSETGSLNTLPNISLRRPTTLTDRGLTINGPGLLIRCGGYQPEGTFLVQDDCGFTYQVRTTLHKLVAADAFEEAVAVLDLHGRKYIHHCVDFDGVLQPLLLMQPHDGGLLIGRKIGMAVIQCFTPKSEPEVLQGMAGYDMNRDGVVGDYATHQLQITKGRNVFSETWCIA